MTTRQISNANLLIPLNLPAVATLRLGETVHVRIGHTVSFFVPQPPKIASGIHLLIQAFINFLFTHAEKKNRSTRAVYTRAGQQGQLIK